MNSITQNADASAGCAPATGSARFDYATNRRDFEALQRIAELEDQVELDAERERLMQNPTKRVAAGMYRAAIELWFREHGVRLGSEEIAERYGQNSKISD